MSDTLPLRPPRTPLARMLTHFTLLYSASMLAWELARLTPLRAWWPLELGAVFDAWRFAPLPLLLLASLLVCRRRTLAVLVVPTLLFGVAYGPQFWPRLPAPSSTTLRVMTWNVFVGNVDARSVAAAIYAENADLVAVQELGATLATPLAETLAFQYPYQLLYPSAHPDGFGVFSRLPLQEISPPQYGPQACHCHVTELALQGRRVTLINVHPDIPRMAGYWRGPLPVITDFVTEHQDPTITAILEIASRAPGAVLVVGDFNTADRMPNYQRMTATLHDAFAESGWGLGYTFPQGRRAGPLPVPALVRIDYILHNDQWHTLAAWTGSGMYSDHRYLLADLALIGGGIGEVDTGS